MRRTAPDGRSGQGDTVRQAESADLNDIVGVHVAAFPDGYLTHLGRGVLSRYYAAYLTHPDAVNVVTQSAGGVRAFIVGTYRASDVLDAFYQANLGYLAWSTVRRVAAMDPVILRGLLARFARVRVAVDAYLSQYRRLQVDSAVTTTEYDGELIGSLVSIATSPEFQGTSISSEMIAHFEEVLRNRGTTDVHLSVLATNGRAIAFYAKCGWEVLDRRGGSLALHKRLA